MSEKAPLRVCVTGAAGQIAYSLLYQVASGYVFGMDQPLILHLLDIPVAMGSLGGVVMEIQDCALPLVRDVVATDDPNVAFKDVDAAFFAGQKRREKADRDERADREKRMGGKTIDAGNDALAEDAEFLADDWDDDKPPGTRAANPDLMISDDDSTDDERDDRGLRKKRARRAGGSVRLGVQDSDTDADDAATEQVIDRKSVV